MPTPTSNVVTYVYLLITVKDDVISHVQRMGIEFKTLDKYVTAAEIAPTRHDDSQY